MKRSVLFGLVGFAILAAACTKPSEDRCRKAIANMRALLGTDTAAVNVDIEGDVRRCKGGSTRTAVECAAGAKTLEDLKACKFMKVPEKKHAPESAGSAAGAGSAP